MPNNGETFGDDAVALLAPKIFSGNESLPAERCLEIHRIMARTRAMEERMIKMSKSGQGYFWIGGPGEEAFNACLGLQVKKGRGPAYDFLHLHYRNSATLVAMGMPLARRHPSDGDDGDRSPLDGPQLRRPLLPPRLERPPRHVGDRGAVRDGAGHRPGAEALRRRRRHHRHRRRRGHGRGRFRLLPGLVHAAGRRAAGADRSSPTTATASPPRPAASTASTHIIDRGKAFGIPGEVVDGNDPVASWHAIRRAMAYCRRERRPLHAGGDGVAAARPFVVERRRPASRTSRTV